MENELDLIDVINNIKEIEFEINKIDANSLSDVDIQALDNYRNSLTSFKGLINLSLENDENMKADKCKELNEFLIKELRQGDRIDAPQATPFDDIKTLKT